MIGIVDFSTIEVVRGSFGYDCYMLYSYMKHIGEDVKLYEDMTPFKLHRIEKDVDEWIIHFWSYPQIESIKWAERNLKGKKTYIGYLPLINKYKLELSKHWDNENLLIGMRELPHIYKEMKYGLMSDCDLHIKSDDKRPVLPLFLSYGCPNKCKFCPIPANRGHYKKDARVQLNIPNVIRSLTTALFEDDRNIHFCDEDMFVNVPWIDNVVDMLLNIQDVYKKMGRKPFKWIGLASVNTFYNYLKKYGEQELINSGCHLIELGIETTDVKLRKEMNKTGSSEHVDYILENSKNINKFWLSVTFFPGETITTLNNIGEWLEMNGTKEEQFGERLITNGNVGGLGQFFQPYDGCLDFEELKKTGMFLTDRPIRLTTSYLPNSFLDDKPVGDLRLGFSDKILNKNIIYFETYLLEKVYKYWENYDGTKTIREIIKGDEVVGSIFFALCSRLRVITSENNK